MLLLLTLPALAGPGSLPSTINALVGLPPPVGWHHVVDDLDGDGQDDVVLRIQQICVGAHCQPMAPHIDEETGAVTERPGPWGVMVVASGGSGITLGAGLEIILPVSDWELVDGVPQWTHGEETRLFEADLPVVSFLSVKNTDTGCAPGLGQNVLVLSGSDAAWALIYREGRWRYVSCGF